MYMYVKYMVGGGIFKSLKGQGIDELSCYAMRKDFIVAD